MDDCDRICSIKACGGKIKARSLCAKHYQRWVRHGDPLYTPDRTSPGEAIGWLRSYIDHADEVECVIWPFSTYKGGYGHMRVGGKYIGAHRVMCRYKHGEPVGPRNHVAHSCGNPSCVNPNHLRWATRAENEADKVIHGTSNNGERHGLAKITCSDVREIRSMGGTVTQRDLAARFGISQPTVNSILSGKTWKSVGN